MNLTPASYPLAPSSRKKGFALLITVTLLAFLVLLLVSLAALTRVETQVATNSQNLGQARQNALMALNIALGQLQKYAGPDQRVTTTADLMASKTTSGSAYPAVIPYSSTTRLAVKSSARYWTGVWGNGEAAINYTARPNAIAPTGATALNRFRGITPLFLNWLVSGNESASFLPNSTLGGVKTPTAAPFTPDLDITNLTSATTALDSNLKFTDVAGTQGILLVGPNSTSDNTTAGKQASIAAGQYVVAPAVSITVPASTIPGLGSASTATTVGRYAYWVGDDGVKARINQQAGYQKTSNTSDEINSFITSQRSALEMMDRDNSGTAIGTAGFDVTNATTLTQLSKMMAWPQVSLLGTTVNLAAKPRFHDLTAYSYGLQSDTYAGGLKKDLTADLADPSTGLNNLEAAITSEARPSDSSPIFVPILPAESTTSPGMPRWTHFRNWARTNPVGGSLVNGVIEGGAVDPSSPAARAAGIYPMFANTSLGINYFFDIEYAGPPNPPNPTPISQVTLKLAFFPFVVLHNPYPITIKGGGNYDVIMRFGDTAKMKLEVDNNEDRNYKYLVDVNLNTLTMTAPPAATPDSTPANTAAARYFRFKVKLEDIPPGQRHIYVLDSNYTNYIPGGPAPVLVRAPNSASIGITNCLTMVGPTLTDPNVQVSTSRVRMHANLSGRTGGNIQNPDGTWDEANRRLVYAPTSLLLTDEDAFPSSTWATITSDAGRSHWLQSMINTYPMMRKYAPGGVFFSPVGKALTWVMVNGVLTERSTNVASEMSGGASIGDLLDSKGANIKATGAFRTSPVHEGHAWYSSSYQVGVTFGSAIRFIANGNLRAPFIQASQEELAAPMPNSGNVRGINDKTGAVIAGSVIAGNTIDDGAGEPHPGMSYNGLGYNKYSTGFGEEPSAGSTTPAILWDLLDSPDKLLSLGQLQHAPFSLYGFQPSYLMGNSYADMRVARNTLFTLNDVVAPNGATQNIYDSAWLINRSLWDKYFVSGIPATWTQAMINAGTPLPNARMTFRARNGTPPSLDDVKYGSGTNKAYDLAADNLLVSGSFNINSTSEQAWRAILAATYKIPLNTAYASANDSVDTAIPFPRFTHNISAVPVGTNSLYAVPSATMRPNPVVTGAGDAAAQTKIRATLYLGNRGLYLNNPNLPGNSSPTAVVNELARSIVNEIRQRGPFLSLADFVNRPLTDAADPAGIKGVLQAGLDNMNAATAQVNPWFMPSVSGGYKLITGDHANGPLDEQYAWNRGQLNEHALGGVSSAAGTPATAPQEIYRSGWAMSPKYLTQADLLSTLGPMLSPRSDTFTIRTYGESTNPVTGESTGKAWCEAIVQRIPDYVDQTDTNIKTYGNATPPSTLPTGINKTFGRRFTVISFRWLTPSDI